MKDKTEMTKKEIWSKSRQNSMRVNPMLTDLLRHFQNKYILLAGFSTREKDIDSKGYKNDQKLSTLRVKN